MNKKQTMIILFTVLLAIGALVGTFMLLIQPKKQELDTAKQTLITEQEILSTLQTKMQTSNNATFEQSVMLQKRVPVKQLLDQVVLEIEKAETLSQSFVLTMDLGDGELEESTDVDRIDLEKEETNTTQTSETTDQVVPQIPAGLKKIVIEMKVESPTYFDMEKFLTTIENSDRIFVIENIEFEGKEEIISVEQEDVPINYNVTVTAFYMPTLTDLLEELPKLEVPKPSNKKDPFDSFADVSSESKQEGE